MYKAYRPMPVTKIYTGPKGGKYVIKHGKRVYIENRPGYIKGNSRKKYGTRRRRGGVISGRGGYWSDFKGWSSSKLKPFERGAGAVGKALFGDAGGEVGAQVGRWLGKITGLGDYKVSQNSLMGMITGGTNAGGVPRVMNKGNGKVTVNHREYIGDVFSSTDFSLQKDLIVNPGNSTCFPWCSDIAVCFEQWIPQGIIFAYESHSADALNSTNTALGSLIFASDYNSSSPSYTNQMEMLNTEYMTSTKPSCSVLHPIECSSRENPLNIYYVSQPNLPDTVDGRLMYNICKTQIATVGSQAEANVGKIFVSYEISFQKPVLNGTAVGNSIKFAHLKMQGNFVAGTSPFGDAQPVFITDRIPGLSVEVDEKSLNLNVTLPPNPDVEYLFQLCWNGGGAAVACAPAGITYGTDCAAGFLFDDNTNTTFPLSTITTTDYTFSTVVVKGPIGLKDSIVSFSADSNCPNSVTSSDIIISIINTESSLSHREPQQLKQIMSPEEERLRKFMSAPENKSLTVEERMALYDRLYPESVEEDVEKKPEEFVKVEDMSSSQLFNLAVKKVTTKV